MQTDFARRSLLYKVAKAYYEDGLTQQQIGARFGVSRIKVSRLLQRARDEGVVQITVIPPQNSDADLERALEHKYGLLESIIAPVITSDPAEVTPALGVAGADYLLRCLGGHEVVGLTWGSTLHALIEALPPQNWPDITVVQLLGGLGAPEAEVHGTDLARRMAQMFGAKLRLIPAPGVVNSTLVRDALLTDAQISGTLALGEQADVGVFGIGIPAAGAVITRSSILAPDEIEQLATEGAVGDIALRFFDRTGRPVQHPVDDRVIGLTLTQIRKIPRRIGIAGGAGKLDVIRAALLGEYINVLVTDSITAQGLLQDAKQPTPILATVKM
jgi:DNA-binding transcriptional regulator LsrR (DeoR family)